MQKGVYPNEYMDDWEIFIEISLSEKEDFYSHLYTEDITHADYAHAKRVFKDFEIKKVGQYLDLYVQSDTLLLADAFDNFRYFNFWNIWAFMIFFSSWISMAISSKKSQKVKLDLLTDIDCLLMIEKGIRRGICHSIFWYPKGHNKYMTDYDKNKESSYIQYWDVNNFYGYFQ